MVPAVVTGACAYLMGTLARTKDVAVGIVSVLYAGESKLATGPQPTTQATDHGGSLYAQGAYGVASWNGKRQDGLEAFAKRYGLKVDDLFTQLHYVVTETANSYPAVWAAMQNPATTYAEMITAFVDIYEDPANKAAEIERSLAYARTIYNEIAAPVPGSPLPAPAAAPAPEPPHIEIPAPIAAALPALIPAVIAAAFPPATIATIAINPATINALVAAAPLFEALFAAALKAAIAAAPRTS